MQHANTKKSGIIFQILAKELRKERERQQKSIRLLAYEFDIQLISIWTLCEALDITPSELMKRIENNLPEDFSLIEK